MFDSVFLCDGLFWWSYMVLVYPFKNIHLSMPVSDVSETQKNMMKIQRGNQH
jgi:hypothetical protein